MMFYGLIKKYYTEGYGKPKRYYTDKQVDAAVKKGLITAKQAEEIKNNGR